MERRGARCTVITKYAIMQITMTLSESTPQEERPLPEGVTFERADVSILETMTEDQWTTFAENLMMHTLEPILDLDEATRQIFMKRLPDGTLSKEDMKTIREMEDWKDIRKYVTDNYKKYAKSGRLFCAKEGDVVVGLVGLPSQKTPDKKEYFEISHLSVLPEKKYRNRGIGKGLMTAAVSFAHSENPQAPVFGYTKNSSVRNAHERLGGKPITPEQHVDLEHGVDEEGRESNMRRRKTKETLGWQAYFIRHKMKDAIHPATHSPSDAHGKQI